MADPIPTEIAGGTSSVATTTVSFASQAAGRLLMLWVASDDYRATSGSGRPESSGWTLERSSQSNLGHYLWWKVAAGGETSVQYTIGSAAKSAYAVTSVTDIDTGSPIDVSASALSSIGSFSSGSTPSSGTTSAGRRIAFGGLGVASPNGAASMASWTNGYTEIHDRFTTVGYRDGVGVGFLVFDGGAATSTGATFSAVCDQVSGITVVLRAASGGGSNSGVLSARVPRVAAAITDQTSNPATLAVTLPRVTAQLAADAPAGQAFKAVGALTGGIGALPQPNLAAGDYCLAYIYNVGSLTTPASSGWAVAGSSVDGVGGSLWVLWKRAATTDTSGTAAFTGGSGSAFGQIVILSGVASSVGAPTAAETSPIFGASYFQTNPLTYTSPVLGVGFGGFFGGYTGTVTGLTNVGTITSTNTLRSFSDHDSVGIAVFTSEITSAAGGQVRSTPAATPGLSTVFWVEIPPNPVGNTAILAATLPKAAAAVSGTQTNPATMDASLPRVTGSISSSHTATLTATLPKITGAFTGAQKNAAILAGTLPKVTGAIRSEEPSAPTGLTATGGNHLAAISFNPVAGAGSYVVEWRRTDLTPPAVQVQDDPPAHLDRIDQPDLPRDDQYHYDFTGDGVMIYVPDSGVRVTHHDFTGRVLTGLGDGWDEDSLPFVNGHGTVLASVALGSIHGVAKGALLVPVQQEAFAPGSGANIPAADFADIVTAIINHASGAEGVVTLSVWITGAATAQYQRLLDAGLSVVRLANYDGEMAAHGTDVIVASGIDGTDARDTGMAAWGPGVDVYAQTDGSMMGSAVSDTAEFLADGGTSVSAPQVAGVLAKIIEANPGLPPARRREVVLSQAWQGKLSGITTGPNRLLNSGANTDVFSDHRTVSTTLDLDLAPAAYEVRVSAIVAGSRTAASAAVPVTVVATNPASFAATLPRATASITGQSTNQASLSAPLLAVKSSITGGSTLPGTLNATVPLPTASLSGVSTNPAALAAALPLVRATLADVPTNPGTIGGTLPRLTSDLTGQSVTPGLLDAKLLKVTALLSGQASNPASINGAVPKLTATIAEDAVNRGNLAATLPGIVGVLSGTAANPAVLAVVLPRLLALISDQTVNLATLDGALPKLTADMSGQNINPGALGATLPGLTCDLAGTVSNPAGLTATLLRPAVNLTGTQLTTGMLAAVLPLLTAVLTDRALYRDITIHAGPTIGRRITPGPTISRTITAGRTTG